MSTSVPSLYQKLDTWVVRVITWISYISAIFLTLIMLIAFFNVIGEKLALLAHNMEWAWFPSWIHGIPNSTEMIQYFHIPVVFLAAAYVTLDRGHTSIDMLSQHFPSIVQKIFITIGHLLGAGITFFISYRALFVLMIDHIQSHSTISTTANSFPVWPFTLVHGIGFAMLGLSFIWAIVRQYAAPAAPKTQEGGEQA